MEHTNRLRSAERGITSQLPSPFMTVRAVRAGYGHRPSGYSIYNNPLQSLLLPSLGMAPVLAPLRPSSEVTDAPSKFARSLSGMGLIDLPLRASNEGLLRPRVARAQKIIRLHPLLCSGSEGSAQVSFHPFSSLRLPPADNDVGLIASLGEGPHIGQHVSALILREADIPRWHVRFAVMDSLEQVGIGFLFGRR